MTLNFWFTEFIRPSQIHLRAISYIHLGDYFDLSSIRVPDMVCKVMLLCPISTFLLLIGNGSLFKNSLYTGCPDTLCPLHSITGQCQTPNLYIFLIPHQFQIYMQYFRSPTWFTYFRWHDLCCGIEVNFVNKICFILGCYNENGYKIVNNWHRPLYHTLFKS